LVVGGVGNGAAGSNGGESRTSATADQMIHRIVINQRTMSAASRGKAFGKHVHDRIECGTRQLPIRISAADQGIKFVVAVLPRRRLGNDVLCQYVGGILRNLQSVEFSTAHAVEQCRTFDQIVAGEWK
jgi:hypothetical protein